MTCTICKSTDKEQEFYKTELCYACYYDLFSDIYSDLEVPIKRVNKESLDINNSEHRAYLKEYKPWAKRAKDIRYSLLDGKWARRFIHYLEEY